jgi:hypothetical protein
MSGELIRVCIFLATVASVYYLAFRWLWVRWRRKPVESSVDRAFRHGATGILLLGTATLGGACIAYGFTFGPKRLTVIRYTLESAKIPAGERVRIVHLADLHVREKGPRERRLPDQIRELEPDLILHTGDFFGAHGMEETVKGLLRSWHVPQYVVMGNLDYLGDFDGVLRDAGVKDLNGAYALEAVRGVTLCIAGVPCGAESGLPRVLARTPPNVFTVVLCHAPSGFPEIWSSSADLMLSGHTHGGQVCVPGYGALVTLDRYGKRFESGHYEENGAHLIVSRGIGCEPHLPEVRFWCPPRSRGL